MKECATRDKIIAYSRKHPDATIRQIQKACNISSPSVVDYHIKRSKYFDYTREALEAENASLKKQVREYQKRLKKIEAALQ